LACRKRRGPLGRKRWTIDAQRGGPCLRKQFLGGEEGEVGYNVIQGPMLQPKEEGAATTISICGGKRSKIQGSAWGETVDGDSSLGARWGGASVVAGESGERLGKEENC